MFNIVHNIETFFKEFDHLAHSHKEEIDLFGMPLDFDKDLYRSAFEDNTFLLFEMRKGEELVGYAGYFMYNNTHHKTSLHAKQDILFIKKENRGQGMSFIKYCDGILKRIGVDFVLQCVPSIGKDWSPILLRLGYSKLETTYSRRL